MRKHNWENDNAGYLKGDPKDNHPERFPHNPEMDVISRLMFRRDELQAEVDKLSSMTYCAYCGKEFPIDDDAGDVSEHIRTCEKHPMREVEAENKRLRETNTDLLEALKALVDTPAKESWLIRVAWGKAYKAIAKAEGGAE